MSPLLSVENLHVHFHTHSGLVKALQGISFHLNPGEILGIVGESGSGKSMTAQAILRLLPPSAQITQGHIQLEGEQLLRKSDKQMEDVRGKRIGMIFQDPMSSLNPTLSIGYQIMEGLIKHEKLPREASYQQALQLLHQVGINDPQKRMPQYPHQLSGGMRQRILMAIALACHPTLLIADEPTTALDVTIQAQILELLKHIHQERRLSLLLITHDLGVVAQMCDRVLVMKEGQIIEEAPVDQLFYSPQHPYTKALLAL